MNGKLVKSQSEYIQSRFTLPGSGFHAITFNPSDHELVRGEPKQRRNYINQAISAEQQEYLRELKNYQKVLDHRNSILKKESNHRQMFSEFTTQLVKMGSYIVWQRLIWLERMNEKIQEKLAEIAPEQGALSIDYSCSLIGSQIEESGGNFSGQRSVPSLEEIEEVFEKKIHALRDAEWAAQSTLVGPQRDDLVFKIGTQVLKGHGSQGEVRSSLLALKKAEIELFQESTGLRPVLLIDDFSSELDLRRREQLLKSLAEAKLQVFVTGTEEPLFEGARFYVSKGMISQQ